MDFKKSSFLVIDNSPPQIPSQFMIILQNFEFEVGDTFFSKPMNFDFLSNGIWHLEEETAAVEDFAFSLARPQAGRSLGMSLKKFCLWSKNTQTFLFIK
jgi:hypothetical protein